MKTISICHTTEEMTQRILDINILALILGRKAGKLYERLIIGKVTYDPYNMKSLGKQTKELDDIQKMLYTLGSLGDSL